MRHPITFALALVMPLAGCPQDDTTDDGADGTDGGNTPTESASDTTANATASADTTGGVGALGVCASTCQAPEDCGAPSDFQCTDGFCVFIALPPPCVASQCIGGVCAFVDGVDTCTFPCTVGGDQCESLNRECIGTNDAGGLICAGPPCFGAAEGEACDIASFGGSIGTCTQGECICHADAECTATDYACNN